MKLRLVAVLFAAVAPLAFSAEHPKFYPDDPMLVDASLVDVPGKPEELELSDLYDRFSNIFKDFGVSAHGTEAANVNTLDELLNGPWFENRHGAKRMSIEELVRGPNRGEPPNPNEKWLVFASKSQGLTPGFQIKDESGNRYLIKFDPVETPEIASAAEVIGTKMFYAIGYHVPENYVVRVDPANFGIEPGTQVEDSFGDKSTLTPFRLRRLLRRIPRGEDGTIRVTASEYIPGSPLGPFRYYGTRTDDPNDIIPHEDRRELRGLRLLAAWLNHDDTRAQNTQDSWVEEGGKHYVRHFLLDFGSTFGSGSVDLQYPNLSFYYWLDPGLVKKNAVSFGFHVPVYRKAHWPPFPEYESVGRWESELFDPVKWRNDYRNSAFVRMTARDAFWAGKILMKFTREELAAIIETGQFSDPKNSQYFLDVLVERQRKSGRFGINVINPLDEFRLENDALFWVNLSERYGFVEAPTAYSVQWSAYDNGSGTTEPLSAAATVRTTEARLPGTPPSGRFLVAEIRSENAENPHWKTAVRIFLRPKEGRYEIVGIERESPEANVFPMN